MHGVAHTEFCMQQAAFGLCCCKQSSTLRGGALAPVLARSVNKFLRIFFWDFQQCSHARFAIICSVAAPSLSDHYLMPRPFPLSVIDLLLTIWSLSWPRSLPIKGRDGKNWQRDKECTADQSCDLLFRSAVCTTCFQDHNLYIISNIGCVLPDILEHKGVNVASKLFILYTDCKRTGLGHSHCLLYTLSFLP